MRHLSRATRPAGRRRLGASLLAAALLAGLGGCEGLLEVQNPNKLVQEDLADPAAARPAVNGSLATVTRALGAILAPYSTATDELTWIGSRDDWRQLEWGNIENHRNEFTDAAFPYVTEGRWMADEAINLLLGYEAQGQLTNRLLLGQAYLYSAVMYISIADMFDDFVLSNRRDPAGALGEASMIQLYDTAIERLGLALQIAEAANNANLHNQVLAVRARAHFSRAVWQKLNPPGAAPADPLVNVAAANADAAALIQRVGAATDWRYQFALQPGLPVGDLSMALQVNQRSELDFAPQYAVRDAAAPGGRRITLMDPIADTPSPFLRREITAFRAALEFAPVTIVSAREMHLILAEAALAQNDNAGFTTHINRLRALDGLTPYSGQLPALDLLKYSRRENLYLQGRRLQDHYRFNDPAPAWQAASAARQRPGTFLPVTCIERRANPTAFPQGC